MKSYIIKIKGHAKSEEQAEKCINSTMLYGFDCQFFNGTTPKTLADAEKIHNFDIMKPSRAFNFRGENLKKYLFLSSKTPQKLCFLELEHNLPHKTTYGLIFIKPLFLYQ